MMRITSALFLLSPKTIPPHKTANWKTSGLDWLSVYGGPDPKCSRRVY
jgi:hypothetical protein